MLKDFEKDCRIDPEALDVECTRQAEIFLKWAERSVEARGEADRAKLRMETIQAELELKCRRTPSKFGFHEAGKPTEAAIKAAVLTHSAYLEAAENHFRAKDDAAMLDKAVAAMEMKKRMLDDLITLHGQSYFAGPSVPRNLGEIWIAQQKESEKKLVKRQVRAIRKRHQE